MKFTDNMIWWHIQGPLTSNGTKCHSPITCISTSIVWLLDGICDVLLNKLSRGVFTTSSRLNISSLEVSSSRLKYDSLELHISIPTFAIAICTIGTSLLLLFCSTCGMIAKLNEWARPIGFKWVAAWMGVLLELDIRSQQTWHNKMSCAQLLHIPLCP